MKKIPENIPAICFNSWVSFQDRAKILKNLREQRIKVLFVTPELFTTDIVWYLLIYGIRLNLLCIDEAHCASVYSHSFRPSYALLEGYLDILSKNSFDHKLRCCFEDNVITAKERQEIAEMDIELESMKKDDDIYIDEDAKQTKPSTVNSFKRETVQKKPVSKVPILCLTATSSRETKQSVMK